MKIENKKVERIIFKKLKKTISNYENKQTKENNKIGDI